MTNLYDIQLSSIDGTAMTLLDYKGDVLLVVNVASECGLTPQYEGLQSLHEQYASRGFKVIGLPCNQFGGQEPGTEEEVKQFCESRFNVTFPMAAKIDVNGENQHPLYTLLSGDDAKFPGDISWNFEKFLIGKNGEVLQRFAPKIEPESQEVVNQIEAALNA
jgi:glutathione peroxidase